ncbi:hypothetical protein JTB14_001042 [Gonioctena quinquepunctata]|nr:hypothetical protein JTB14_001042 [Gonioctena quinquepunctata]
MRSANAKKWEIELATLKSNNARLTSALQESTANVDEWKRQLASLKEENMRMKAKYQADLENSKGGGELADELRKEIQSLRIRVEQLESELDSKNSEIKILSSSNKTVEIQSLQKENQELQSTIKLAQSELEIALGAHDSQKQVLLTLNQQLASRIHDLATIHDELTTALQTFGYNGHCKSSTQWYHCLFELDETSFDCLKNLIFENDFDVVVITETWLSPDIQDDTVRIQGYGVVRRDRLYYKAFLSLEVLENNDSDHTLEQLWVMLRIQNNCIGLGGVYRPPHTNVLDSITALENTIYFLYPSVDEIILADFIEAYGMSIMNNEPTRVTEISSTLIDIIAVTNKNMVVSTHTRNADDISDHCLVYCLLQYKVNKPQQLFKTHRDYKYFVYDDFLDDLRLMPWYDIYQTDDINQIVSLFNTYLLSVFNVHAPVKTVRTSEKIRTNIVAQLFNKAFGRVATVEKATKGFEVTGIFPVNRDVFTAEDFAPAENLNPTNSSEAIPRNEQETNPPTLSYHDCEEEENKSDTEVTEDICITCGEFVKNRELWLRCVSCSGWAHRDCTDGDKKKTYVCDFCQ